MAIGEVPHSRLSADQLATEGNGVGEPISPSGALEIVENHFLGVRSHGGDVATVRGAARSEETAGTGNLGDTARLKVKDANARVGATQGPNSLGKSAKKEPTAVGEPYGVQFVHILGQQLLRRSSFGGNQENLKVSRGVLGYIRDFGSIWRPAWDSGSN